MGSFYEDQFKDSDQCKICDRNNAKVVCLHCGNEWKVIIKFFYYNLLEFKLAYFLLKKG